MNQRNPGTRRTALLAGLALFALGAAGAPLSAAAQAQPAAEPNGPGGQPGARPTFEPGAMVTLDFADAELAQVIETIARATNRNFIYDDRVRGRVTIVSPDPIPVEQAYAVFESVLQVKGFTTVMTPGGAIKVVPVREAKESSIETVLSSKRPPNRDTFVTRLIPLRYIDADSIVNTLKPLVSKDAAMAAYPPTNTVILTESSSNIRRLIQILESIDVETYKEDLAVINVEYADAATLADQISEIYGAEVAEGTGGAFDSRRARRRVANPGEQAGAGPTAHKPPVRILTDDRTNSLLVLAPRAELEEVRRLVAKLDVPVPGGGRIHVYYLKNAKAEELAETLSGLVGGGGGGGGSRSSRSTLGGGSSRSRRSTTTPGGATVPAAGTIGGGTSGVVPSIRSEVAGLEGGISITADTATNSLIIQASQEGFNTLAGVIAKLDVERPQVSVEALIMELTVNDTQDLGFNGLLKLIDGNQTITLATATSAASAAATGVPVDPADAGALLGQILKDTRSVDSSGNRTGDGSVIDSIIDASAKNGDINIVSAPHILTSDNEEAEIRVGNNIPIISSRVESASGVSNATGNLASSVNVERQDIGVTLRVTPQITEGDSLRLEIFQEITDINNTLQSGVGQVEDVGPALTNRRVENTVVVRDGETVVIGGLLSDTLDDTVTKVPWLGDIPFFGWLFKSTSTEVRKTNLLVFLTPRIVRTPIDLEDDSIRRREEFLDHSGKSVEISDEILDEETKRLAAAREEGVPYFPKHYQEPVKERLAGHSAEYPVGRVKEIEAVRAEERAKAAARQGVGPRYLVQAATLTDADKAAALLTDLIDSGHDGTLVSTPQGDRVVYEIQLGPFETLEQANAVGVAVRKSHGLAPAIVVVEGEKKNE
jgi:general secretion pathway protein D